jgi:hypothetical protein
MSSESSETLKGLLNELKQYDTYIYNDIVDWINSNIRYHLTNFKLDINKISPSYVTRARNVLREINKLFNKEYIKILICIREYIQEDKKHLLKQCLDSGEKNIRENKELHQYQIQLEQLKLESEIKKDERKKQKNKAQERKLLQEEEKMRLDRIHREEVERLETEQMTLAEKSDQERMLLQKEKRKKQLSQEKGQLIPIYNKSKCFPNGRACPHCLWIEDNEYLYNYYHKNRIMRMYKKDRYMGQNEDPKNLQIFFSIFSSGSSPGLTIFDNHLVFKNSLLCVLGVKGNQPSHQRHSYKKIGSLLNLVIDFVTNDLLIHYDNIRIIINSHVDESLHGIEKEHLHAWVTLMNENDARHFFGGNIKYIQKKKEPGDKKEFPDDINIALNNNQCRELIEQGDDTIFDHINALIKKANPKLKNFDGDRDNFYIMLKLKRGEIKGTISVPFKEKKLV